MRYDFPIRVSIVGVGHMGSLHAEKLKDIDGVKLVGVWDKDTARAEEIAEKADTKVFSSFDDAVGYAQAVILATPTETHGRLGLQVLKRMRHLFIEKPIASNEQEAEILINLAKDYGLVLMVGHIENFNPAFVKAREFIEKPLFIEAHRLTAFRGRGADVSVVEDLMVHDIEILIKLCKSEVDSIDASAATVLTDSLDIANVRIKFEDGCVANLTASRLSLSQKRKMRIFQHNAYIAIDFDKRAVEVIRPAEENAEGEVISMGDFKLEVLHPEVPESDPLEAELKHFVQAIRQERPVDSEPALQALRLAKHIVEEVR